MSKEESKRGRKPYYDKLEIEKRLPEIEKWYEQGATDIQVCEILGVSQTTFYKWVKENPKLVETIKSGKSVADQRVVNALYQRATGYSHPDVHITAWQGEAIITPVTKHYAPDTAAAFIWLKNRAGWRDKQELDIRDIREQVEKEFKGNDKELLKVAKRILLESESDDFEDADFEDIDT